jgi:23S rRNA (pseudouridine1915-N3)-methyltransferase
MLKIGIIAVDKLRAPYWRDAAAEYLKRLGPLAKIEIVEVASEPITPTVTAARSMAAEGRRLLDRLPEDTTIIALDRLGKRYSSEAFADVLKDESASGRGVTFVVGGAAGLAPDVLARAQKKISLSEMTFTHEMARVVLLEQVYRAMTITAGKSYHY